VIAIERLRALEKKWRETEPTYTDPIYYDDADRLTECADELSTLIAELGQEVGAVAWIAPSSLESLNICRKDEHNGFVEVWMRPDECRTIPLYLSPAHTSEARDSRGRFFAGGPNGLHFYADSSDFANRLIVAAGYDRDDWTVTDLHNPAGDAAMRQEGGNG
jgi:hypothetical protein